MPEEQKANLPLYVPSLALTYYVMPHNVTGLKTYELMLGHKVPTVCDA